MGSHSILTVLPLSIIILYYRRYTYYTYRTYGPTEMKTDKNSVFRERVPIMQQRLTKKKIFLFGVLSDIIVARSE